MTGLLQMQRHGELISLSCARGCLHQILTAPQKSNIQTH
jgi:hypothetical protein